MKLSRVSFGGKELKLLQNLQRVRVLDLLIVRKILHLPLKIERENKILINIHINVFLNLNLI